MVGVFLCSRGAFRWEGWTASGVLRGGEPIAQVVFECGRSALSLSLVRSRWTGRYSDCRSGEEEEKSRGD